MEEQEAPAAVVAAAGESPGARPLQCASPQRSPSKGAPAAASEQQLSSTHLKHLTRPTWNWTCLACETGPSHRPATREMKGLSSVLQCCQLFQRSAGLTSHAPPSVTETRHWTNTRFCTPARPTRYRLPSLPASPGPLSVGITPDATTISITIQQCVDCVHYSITHKMPAGRDSTGRCWFRGISEAKARQ